MYAYMNARMYACMYVCMHACMYDSMHACKLLVFTVFRVVLTTAVFILVLALTFREATAPQCSFVTPRNAFGAMIRVCFCARVKSGKCGERPEIGRHTQHAQSGHTHYH